jgi:hypothetical protein
VIATAGERLAGSVRWAVVPFVPRPPFRLYAGTDHPPIDVATADAIIEPVKKQAGDPEHTYLVPGKVRPVLLLSEPSRHHDEITALRLIQLPKLTEDEQQLVREQGDELLFYLNPGSFKLRQENAAMVSALVRLHVDALESGPALGRLNDNEMRVLGERIIRFYGFDTRLLVERRVQELIEERKAR